MSATMDYNRRTNAPRSGIIISFSGVVLRVSIFIFSSSPVVVSRVCLSFYFIQSPT